MKTFAPETRQSPTELAMTRRPVTMLLLVASVVTHAAGQSRISFPLDDASANPGSDLVCCSEVSLSASNIRQNAQRRGTFIATFAPYTHHMGKGDYNSRPVYRGLEWESLDRWTVGGASFQNSFRQPCWYAFAGKRFQLKHRSGRFFAKVTSGIIYGYKPPHKDAVPLNWGGYNPAIIPSIGYQYKGLSIQFVVFGRAYGAMPMLGAELR